jgi:hypothetical protein
MVEAWHKCILHLYFKFKTFNMDCSVGIQTCLLYETWQDCFIFNVAESVDTYCLHQSVSRSHNC